MVARSEVREGRPAPYEPNDIHMFIEFLERVGFQVDSPKVVRGSSGIEHTFDIYAVKDHANVVLDVVSAPGAVGPEKVVGFFAKLLDTGPMRGVLIAMPELEGKARKLSVLYGVETIDGRQMDEILVKLSHLLEHPTPQAVPKVRIEELNCSTDVTAEPERPEVTPTDEILRRARSRMARILEESNQQVS